MLRSSHERSLESGQFNFQEINWYFDSQCDAFCRDASKGIACVWGLRGRLVQNQSSGSDSTPLSLILYTISPILSRRSRLVLTPLSVEAQLKVWGGCVCQETCVFCTYAQNGSNPRSRQSGSATQDLGRCRYSTFC